ncbi:MAG: DUF2071 domain-containing protein [Saprospiraceae bacterium]
MGIPKHPFAVEAFFEHSLVLTFAVPKAQLEGMIPDRLELDTFKDEWAFIAVAMVQTSGLRPAGLPKIFGNNFFLIGYRIFVRYTNKAGKRLRGLYILKSETDSRKMEFLGNLMTNYKYTTTDITETIEETRRTITSKKSDLKVVATISKMEATLPHGTPFETWKEARRFAGPLPFTFSYNTEEDSMLVVQGLRQNWTPKPVSIEAFEVGFLTSLKLKGLQLASGFEVSQIPYRWKKGLVERWS